MHLAWDDLTGRLAACHLARTYYRPGHRVGLHDHDFAELCWVASGRLEHFTPRGNTLLSAGDGMLVAPHHRHGLRCVDEPSVLVNCAVPGETWRRWCASYGSLPGWPWPESPDPVPFRGDLDQLARIEALARGDGDALAVDAAVVPLLERLRPDPLRAALADAPSWLAEAIHACAEPPGLVGGIAAITAASGRSREHCARSIRSHLGRSAGELVRDLRCDWLARQLRLGDTPFAELCAELGAANVAHLHRHFRRRFGHTPGDYRRRLRGVARAEPRRTGG